MSCMMYNHEGDAVDMPAGDPAVPAFTPGFKGEDTDKHSARVPAAVVKHPRVRAAWLCRFSDQYHRISGGL